MLDWAYNLLTLVQNLDISCLYIFAQCLSLLKKNFYTQEIFCQILLLLMSEHFLLLFDTWEFSTRCSVVLITCCSVWFWCLHVSWHSKLLRLRSNLVKHLVCDMSVFMAVLPRDLRFVTLKEASICHTVRYCDNAHFSHSGFVQSMRFCLVFVASYQ